MITHISPKHLKCLGMENIFHIIQYQYTIVNILFRNKGIINSTHSKNQT